MELVSNWKDVVKKAWSVKFMILAGILSGAEVALPYLQDVIQLPSGMFASLAGLVTAAALFARVVAQNLDPDTEETQEDDVLEE